MFWVSLIKLLAVPSAQALACLEANCTKINDVYWIMEGDVEVLTDAGAKLEVVTEGAVDSLGDLTEKGLKEVCKYHLGVEIP